MSDLEVTSKAFGEVKGPKSVEDKQSALAKLDTLSADDDYRGILCQVFALPGWVALLEKSKLTAKPTADRLKDLDDHILKKNNAVIDGALEQVDFAECLADCLALQDNEAAMRKRLEALLLVSQNSKTKCTELLKGAWANLTTHLQGDMTALDADVKVKSGKNELKDIKTRYVIDIADVVGIAPDTVAKATQVFDDIFKQFGAHRATFESVQEYLNFAVDIHVDISLVVAGKVDIRKIMKKIAGLKDFKRVAALSLEDAIVDFEALLGSEQKGIELYEADLDDFRQQLRSVTTKAVESWSTGKQTIDTKTTESFKKSIHVLLQEATWSKSPLHDRSAINFAKDHLLPIFAYAAKLHEIKVTAPKDWRADASVLQHLKCVLNAEESAPMLNFCYDGAPGLSDMIESMCKEQLAALEPLLEKSVAESVALVSEQMETLQRELIDESTPLCDDDFFSKLDTAKVKKLRAAKQKLLQVVEACNMLHKKLCKPAPEVCEEATTESDRAKLQTVKYGFLAFLHAKSIKSTEESGVKARANLQSIYNTHKLDKQVMEYIGEDLQAAIDAVLKMDNECEEKASPAKRKATGATNQRKKQKT